MKIAVIGCGPAGLLAAHAAVLKGHEVKLWALEAKPSPHARATYLHRSIPELTSADPDAMIKFHAVGSPMSYSQKVYGDPRRSTSWATFARSGERPAWALAPVYEDLWERFERHVYEWEVTYRTIAGLHASFDLVINTAPAPAMCERNHEFKSHDIWVKPESWLPENTMCYNGLPGTNVIRESNIFGAEATEYNVSVPGASKGIKVGGTDCDCHPKMVRAGRWGTWKSGVLVHHAFEVADALL